MDSLWTISFLSTSVFRVAHVFRLSFRLFVGLRSLYIRVCIEHLALVSCCSRHLYSLCETNTNGNGIISVERRSPPEIPARPTALNIPATGLRKLFDGVEMKVALADLSEIRT